MNDYRLDGLVTRIAGRMEDDVVSQIERRLGEVTCRGRHALADAKIMTPRPGVTAKPNTVTVLCKRCEPHVYARVEMREDGRLRAGEYSDQFRARRSFAASRRLSIDEIDEIVRDG